MIARRRQAGRVAGCLLCLLVAACAGRRVSVPDPTVPAARTATAEELLEFVRDLAGRAAEFTTKADFELVDLASDGRRSVKLRMAARKPQELRMHATKTLLPTLFVLVSNADGVWLDVPSRGKTYTLPAGHEPAADAAGNSLLAFGTRDFLRSLVPDPPRTDEVWSLTEEPAVYTLAAHVRQGEQMYPTRQLEFERHHLNLAEQRLYEPGGRIISRTRFFPADADLPLPAMAHIERPFERVAMVLRFDDTRAGTLSDSVFQFERPPGRLLVDVSVDAADVPGEVLDAEEDR